MKRCLVTPALNVCAEVRYAWERGEIPNLFWLLLFGKRKGVYLRRGAVLPLNPGGGAGGKRLSSPFFWFFFFNQKLAVGLQILNGSRFTTGRKGAPRRTHIPAGGLVIINERLFYL